MNAAPLTAMKRRRFASFVIAAIFLGKCLGWADENKSSPANAEPTNASIKLIYDGDIGPDPCDFSTLSMLHEYHNKGMIELVGVVGETPDLYLASTFSIYNQRYGNEIPIGAFNGKPGGVTFPDDVKKGYVAALSQFCHTDPNKKIYEKFGNEKTKTAKDVPHSVEVYRKLLSKAADNSITLYAAGQLFNFPALFKSPGDEYSPLNGEELLKKKVKEFVLMGGWFPDSAKSPWYRFTNDAEWNWWAFRSKNTTKTTIETLVRMGRPITYIGAEQGPRILVGKEMVARLGREHPTTESYYLFKRTAQIPKDSEYGLPVLTMDNPAFDDIALFYAVEGGVGEYFDRIRGRVQINEFGANTWLPGEGNESYLTIKIGVEPRLREVITDRITGKF